MGTKTVAQRIAHLREKRQQILNAPQRTAHALNQVASLWQTRLNTGWTPPAGSTFPWAMVRRSLEGLVVDGRWSVVREAGAGAQRTPRGQGSEEGHKVLGIGHWEKVNPLLNTQHPPHRPPTPDPRPPVLALVLAGNTPLLAWPALVAALVAGVPVFVKLSREEGLWTRLFVEALAEVDNEIAGLVDLEAWPGEDIRTTELLQEADAVVAYGSDATIAALRQKISGEKPFYGFGHAISVGIVLPGEPYDQRTEGFAYDMLMYGQQGCLSPQAVFVVGTAETAQQFAEGLVTHLGTVADTLEVLPVADASVAFAVRNARDMAIFYSGITVYGDEELRWTVIAYRDTVPLTIPIGHGVLTVIPVPNIAEEFGELAGAMRGKISAVGYTGRMTRQLEDVLRCEGITYLCPAGQMQAPPLDWPNGNRDLFQEMRRLAPQSV